MKERDQGGAQRPPLVSFCKSEKDSPVRFRCPLSASPCTSIQPSQWEYSVSSSQVSSMAELELPAAGNTVAKRLRDTSR